MLIISLRCHQNDMVTRCYLYKANHMGKKGDKLTSAATDVAQKLVEDLESIGEICSKKMFGGHGIFHEGKMFGMVDSKGQVFFKVDESNKPDFVAAGSVKHSRMPYYSIPDIVNENKTKLVQWAINSIYRSK
jgi:DNA transformation protein